MSNPPHLDLGRRERQIVEVLHRLGQASAAEVRRQLPDPPSYSAVRGMLRYLETKGHVVHERAGARYIYRPAVEPERARRSALQHLVRTFFAGSRGRAAVALLESPTAELAEADLRRLSELIRQARARGD
jgi:predicted transcriptional regulator